MTLSKENDIPGAPHWSGCKLITWPEWQDHVIFSPRSTPNRSMTSTSLATSGHPERATEDAQTCRRIGSELGARRSYRNGPEPLETGNCPLHIHLHLINHSCRVRACHLEQNFTNQQVLMFKIPSSCRKRCFLKREEEENRSNR